MSGVPVLCAVACFHTRTDTLHGNITAQIHSIVIYSFILNVVVSLMIHDKMYVYQTIRPKVPGGTLSIFHLFYSFDVGRPPGN